MSSSFLLILLAVLLGGTLLVLLQADGGLQNLPQLLREAGVPIPTKKVASPQTQLPAAFTNGSSRFSQGSCRADSECSISGCSGEVCGRKEAVSTCEFSEDFPSDQKYTCGCNQGYCGWRR